ncbi:uncharacterized protein LOC18439218 isoform X1 [Amborella trichopoda]|uniref:uncharacterized protein LOC18439218 isoform X1 n=1 Tax=Amborella trichopoda TaxID=13333 RepID=UPI0009BCB087|nr:uncharacterized protein LOC18439218 isoform X1 [Amborella trichopoda]|eukprot:XP_020526084.1 uncharacterized protein LOC18439218 isoform X1 [Amborella trichopoda]
MSNPTLRMLSGLGIRIRHGPIYSGFTQIRKKQSFSIGNCKDTETKYDGRLQHVFGKVSVMQRITSYSRGLGIASIRAAAAERNIRTVPSDDAYDSEPLWLSLIRETFSGLKSLLMFLLEQPGQLKYIEWPSFKSTLKTATLTLVLVAVLVVILSSVDSVLWFLLALVLRKSP